MTALIDCPAAVAQALRHAAVAATLAPSVHNTQPWRFRIVEDDSGGMLEVHADFERRLAVLDPYGRQLLLSCGCALFNARVALAHAGYGAVVERFPDPRHPALLARIHVSGTLPVDEIAVLAPAVERRRTCRRPFDGSTVPPDVVADLVAAARAEGAVLVPVTRADDRLAVTMLSEEADRIENDDPGYRAELRAWTAVDPGRADGVPAAPGAVAGAGASPVDQTLLVLGARTDAAPGWLAAGEALERVLLEITARGWAATPVSPVVEVARTNEQLRSRLGLDVHPQLLVRAGRAPETPAVRRRRLADMIVRTSAP